MASGMGVIHLCLYLYLFIGLFYLCVYEHIYLGPQGGQNWTSDSLELEIQSVVSHMAGYWEQNLGPLQEQ